MKTIRLMRLEAVHFRGLKALDLDFSGQSAAIYGRNGIGKSTIMSAFLWCLFGKDAEGRKDFELKTRTEQGATTPEQDVEVRLTLSVDGAEVRLVRRLVEQWVKPRGEAERVFRGNKTEYFHNDVPLTMRAYEERVGEIIDEGLFRLLTDPAVFVSLPWQEQRERLFEMAGAVTDQEIAALDSRFADFLGRIAGKGMSDYLREVAMRKRKSREALDTIGPRMDQTQRMMPEAEDWDDLQAQIDDLGARMRRASELIRDASARDQQRTDQLRALRTTLADQRGRLDELLEVARAQERRRALSTTEARSEAERVLNTRRAALMETQARLKALQHAQAQAEAEAVRLEGEQSELRKAWQAVSAEGFPQVATRSVHCPHCGAQYALESEDAERLRSEWLDVRNRRLQTINAEGRAIGDRIAQLRAEGERARQARLTEEIQALSAALEQAQATLEATPEGERAREITIADVPEAEALAREIETTERAIAQMSAQLGVGVTPGCDLPTLSAQLKAYEEERNALQRRLARREDIERGERELERLRTEGRRLSEEIATLEGEEATAQALTRARIDEAEARINALFGTVRYRLIDYTQDGSAYECCIPMVAGVPIGAVNTAATINAGLDIIGQLQRHYGYVAPIFVDGAERVTDLIHTEGQMIRLIVSPEDKVLRMAFEE